MTRSQTIWLVLLFAAFQAGMLVMRLWLASDANAHQADTTPQPANEVTKVQLSPQARSNLGLVARQVWPQTYWRTLEMPGVIEDRPGLSDRSVAAPTTGVVARILAHPGETVQPGGRLFTLRASGDLQAGQSELFKTRRDLQIAKEQLDRLSAAAQGGAVPQSKIIDLSNEIRRHTAAEQSQRQELRIRGLTDAQIAGVAEGDFVSEITLLAPKMTDRETDAAMTDGSPLFEVQDLHVELGQQVQTGQTLCQLANHQLLLVEGRSFRPEAPHLEQAAAEGRPIEMEVESTSLDAEANASGQGVWPPWSGSLHIQSVANTVDAESRTLAFYLPLENQRRTYQQAGQTFVVWRFRPGQRVRLHVPVEELKDVIVLPAAALVRDGAEAVVFRQNGDWFERLSVRVLHQDRLRVVLAHDGSVAPGSYVAQSAAAALLRTLRAKAASGAPANVHVHADGTVHEH